MAVNAAGTLAAVALSAKASAALIDLSQKQVVAVIGTGYYPSHPAFSGSNLLVANEASGTVSVIDTSQDRGSDCDGRAGAKRHLGRAASRSWRTCRPAQFR